MEQEKYNYFLVKYRGLDRDDLIEASNRINELAEEASAALRLVLSEKDEIVPPHKESSTEARFEPTPEEREKQTKLASELWNSPLAKLVQRMFAAHGIVFSYSLFGPRGLWLGAIPLGTAAALLMYIAGRLGRKVTRRVCANGNTNLKIKTKTLKTLVIALWPLAILPAAAGILLARLVRGL
jgi:hypothetical protein